MVNQGRGLRWAQLAGIALVVGGAVVDRLAALPQQRAAAAAGLVDLRGAARRSWPPWSFGAGLPVRRFLRGEATQAAQPDPGGPHPGARPGRGPDRGRRPRAGMPRRWRCVLAGPRPAVLPRPDVAAPRPVSRRGPAGGRRHGRPSGCAASTPRRARRGGLSPTCRRRPTTKNIEPRIATMSAMRLPGSTSPSTATLLNDAERSLSRHGVFSPRETR